MPTWRVFFKIFLKKINSHFNYITKLCFCQIKFFREFRIEFLDLVLGKLCVCRVCRGFTEKGRIGLRAAALPKMDKIEQMFYMRTIEHQFDFSFRFVDFFWRFCVDKIEHMFGEGNPHDMIAHLCAEFVEILNLHKKNIKSCSPHDIIPCCQVKIKGHTKKT